MLIKLKSLLRDINNSSEFKEFKEKHPNSYLSSCFYSSDNWQADFYCPDNDNMTSFTVKDRKINLETSDVFRKEKKEIKELKIEELEVGINEAKKIMANLIEEEYKGEEINKEIIILQNLEAPLWNITYITKTMNIIHVKIHAISGQILEEKRESALSFKA